MLNHQTGLQQPRIALRRLFSNAGDAIRAYTPCLMMSPMSVAQYLEPGKHLFDLLVVDEASQMKPENALGRAHALFAGGDRRRSPAAAAHGLLYRVERRRRPGRGKMGLKNPFWS